MLHDYLFREKMLCCDLTHEIPVYNNTSIHVLHEWLYSQDKRLL